MKRKIIILIITLIIVIGIGILTGTGKISQLINQNERNNENKEIVDIKQIGLVEKIKVEEKSNKEEAKHSIILEGLDKDNNIKWTYKTKEVYVAQYDNLEYFGENSEKVYINEEGTIVALDKQTGNIVWKNTEYKESGSLFIFDKEGYLYLVPPVTYTLFVVDTNGKTVRLIKEINKDEFYWPKEIKIQDDKEIVIYYPKEFDGIKYNDEIKFYIEDIKNTQNRILEKEIDMSKEKEIIYGFQTISKFNLDSNGEVTLTYKDTNETIKLAQNVKNIYYLFLGNGGFGALVMIKNNGEIVVLNSEEIYTKKEVKVKEKNINNADYIVTNSAFEGQDYYVITKDGKTINNFDIKYK